MNNKIYLVYCWRGSQTSQDFEEIGIGAFVNGDLANDFVQKCYAQIAEFQKKLSAFEWSDAVQEVANRKASLPRLPRGQIDEEFNKAYDEEKAMWSKFFEENKIEFLKDKIEFKRYEDFDIRIGTQTIDLLG